MILPTCSLHGDQGTTLLVLWTFLGLTWDLNACASVWLFLPTYFAADLFERASLSTEKTAR
jgi:hypothetical protein